MKINLIEYFVETVRRFPERNAIIDGERKVNFAELDVLARRTAGVIVESANKGGALVTANIAASYSRDVFAVPGRVTDEYSKGCNRLIMNNQAAAITCAEDLVKAMRWELKLVPEKSQELELFPQLTAEQQKVVDLLRKQGDQHINDLSGLMALPIYRLMAILVELDTKGVIATLPGCRYTLKR